MSGGKGGGSTTKVTVPEWLEEAAQRNMARADEVARIGYVPYYGPDVAGMGPGSIAAGGGINAAASAFGMPTMDMGPAPQDFGGIPAYSSAPLYQASLDQLRMTNPAQYAMLTQGFLAPPPVAAPAPVAAPPSSGLLGPARPEGPMTSSNMDQWREYRGWRD